MHCGNLSNSWIFIWWQTVANDSRYRDGGDGNYGNMVLLHVPSVATTPPPDPRYGALKFVSTWDFFLVLHPVIYCVDLSDFANANSDVSDWGFILIAFIHRLPFAEICLISSFYCWQGIKTNWQEFHTELFTYLIKNKTNSSRWKFVKNVFGSWMRTRSLASE